MKHAGPAALDRLKSLLVQLRTRQGLREKSPGVFYLRGRAFLHFHEHGENELFADIRASGKEFVRVAIITASERKTLLGLVDGALPDGTSPKRR